MSRNQALRVVGVLAIAATFCTIVVGAVAHAIMETYYSVQPIWVEHVVQTHWPSLKTLSVFEHSGRWTALEQVLDGQRHILQSLLLCLTLPGLLGWIHGHLFFVLPAFATLLGLLGWTVYRKTGVLTFSIGAMFLYCAFLGLLSARTGIGAGFADYQSALLLGSAVLCLLNGLDRPKLAWLLAFGLLFSTAILARTSSLSLGLVIAGPMLLVYLLKEYGANRSLKPTLFSLGSLLILAAPTLFIVHSQLGHLYSYYTSGIVPARLPIAESARSIVFLLVQFVGRKVILVCLLFFIAIRGFEVISRSTAVSQGNWALLKQGARFEWTIVWWSLSFFMTLMAYGYTSNMPKEVIYVLPALLLGALLPPFRKPPHQRGILRLLGIGLILFSIFAFVRNANINLAVAGSVTPFQARVRQTQIEMASALSDLPEGLLWQSYTSPDWGIPVSLWTYYKYGKFRQSYSSFFHSSRKYWDAQYPGLSLSQLQETLYTKTLRSIDIVVVLKDPGKKPAEMEEYSYSIAAYMADRVISDQRWQYRGGLEGEPYDSELAIYQNTTR